MPFSYPKLENWEKEQLPRLLDESPDSVAESSAPIRSSAAEGIIRLAVASAERAMRVKRRIADVSVLQGTRLPETALEQRLVGLFAE